MAEEGFTEFIIDLPQEGFSGQSVSVKIN